MVARRYLTSRRRPHVVLVFDDKKTRDLYWIRHDQQSWWIDWLGARQEMIRETGLPWSASIDEVVVRYLADHPDCDMRNESG